MKREFSIFVGGLAVGIGAMVLWPDSDDELVQSENVAARNGPDEEVLALELKKAESEIARLQNALENTNTTASMGVDRTELRPPVTKLFSSGTVTLDGKKGDFVMTRIGNHSDQRVKLLQQRLGLSDDQTAAFREILELKNERFTRMLETGERPAAGLMVTQNDLHDLAADILTEEQLSEYDRLVAEERRGRNEMMAVARLNRLSPALNLSEEQRDALYGVYYNEADSMVDGITREGLEQSQSRTRDSIREILSESQFETFEEFTSSPGSFGSANAVFIGSP